MVYQTGPSIAPKRTWWGDGPSTKKSSSGSWWLWKTVSSGIWWVTVPENNAFVILLACFPQYPLDTIIMDPKLAGSKRNIIFQPNLSGLSLSGCHMLVSNIFQCCNYASYMHEQATSLPWSHFPIAASRCSRCLGSEAARQMAGTVDTHTYTHDMIVHTTI